MHLSCNFLSLNSTAKGSAEMKLNRVVVTGYGLTSQLEIYTRKNLDSALRKENWYWTNTKFDHSEFAVHNTRRFKIFL